MTRTFDEGFVNFHASVKNIITEHPLRYQHRMTVTKLKRKINRLRPVRNRLKRNLFPKSLG